MIQTTQPGARCLRAHQQKPTTPSLTNYVGTTTTCEAYSACVLPIQTIISLT